MSEKINYLSTIAFWRRKCTVKKKAMGKNEDKEESFSEKLDRLIETIQTGDLSTEKMELRDTIKSELVTMYLSKNSNKEKLDDAIKEINEIDVFDESEKKELREIKICVFEIAEAMDPGQFNRYSKVLQRFNQLFKRSTQRTSFLKEA